MKLSLIIPCYNEETNLQKGVLDKIGNFTKDDSRIVEVIIVDDGSSDRSKKIIKDRYLAQFPKFKLIENAHQGKAHTVITGIKVAKGDYVVFSDIDLATPIEEINLLIKEAATFPIVIGSRNSQRAGAPLTRKIMAHGAVIVRGIMLGLWTIKDTQCGFKLFKKQNALKVIDRLQVASVKRTVKGSSVSAAFDMEFLFIASRLGYKIKEVPVIWKHVETKNVNFLKDSFETLRDILKIKYYQLCGKYSLNS